jgi:acyl-CoA dehydrogenase
VSLADPELIEALRQTVRALCRDFPPPYWRALDREKAYPTDFVGHDQGRPLVC